jgi:predicted ABC-type sugar transport system permease subunit
MAADARLRIPLSSLNSRDGGCDICRSILGGTSFVGGIGTITGTLIGALIIATLNNGMTLTTKWRFYGGGRAAAHPPFQP